MALWKYMHYSTLVVSFLIFPVLMLNWLSYPILTALIFKQANGTTTTTTTKPLVPNKLFGVGHGTFSVS
jgi:hypothetical protein